jgi:Cytochrome C and Quinol oxidase polypeptide I
MTQLLLITSLSLAFALFLRATRLLDSPLSAMSACLNPHTRPGSFVRFVGITITNVLGRISYFISNWVLSTNHRRIAVMYFIFTIITGFTGLILATIIRIELAYPGQGILNNNSEKYLTIAALHAIVMVFFVVIPILFGAFGNFLLPTQLGIRDVAFPRLNSFMF